MHLRNFSIWRRRGACAATLLLALSLAACGSSSGTDGAAGAPGAPGAPGTSTGVFTGTVTNATTGLPVSGCAVTLDPPVVTGIVTAPDGTFSATLPVGNYTASCGGTGGYTTVSSPVSVLAGMTTTQDFAMPPTSPVVVKITGAPTSPAPGASFTLTASVTVMDGSTVQSHAWTQDAPAPATIASPDAPSTLVTLAAADAYKTELLAGIEPLERWRGLPISPHALGAGAAKTFNLSVTTSSGTYKASAKLTASLPFAKGTASGLLNVPLALPVLFGGKTQASYSWSFATKPGLSTAVLNDASTRYPWFVPDVPGTYTVQVTDNTVAPPATVRLDVYAGRWEGAIIGMDATGKPTTSCTTACHTIYYPEKFTEWAASGHASIFSTQINESDHYGSSCFSCHTVGFDLGATNNGIDESAGYADFLATMWPGGHGHIDSGNWAEVLTKWPAVAQKANIQCENCHGPNGAGSAHVLLGTSPDPRISTSADVCGACHGEPPRHGRFQQWEMSRHANFETAIAEGTSGSCSKCHSAQGFLYWAKSGFTKTLGTTGNPPVPTANDVQPITCVVCHDPHAVGTTSGNATNAPMRVEGDTPPLDAGFTATDVGQGAICMVCHNSRRVMNDTTFPSTPDRAPHRGPQADVLFGRNAFFVQTGNRSDHAWITDTCVTCHVKLSAPPPEFSLNAGGTNHSFTADPGICTKCHGSFDGGTLREWYEGAMLQLEASLEGETLAEIQALVGRGYTLTLTHATGTVTITSSTTIGDVTLAESHGASGFQIVLDGTTYTGIRYTGAVIKDGAGTAVGNLVSNSLFATNEPALLGKSLWNFFYMEADGSKGVHNPAFAEDILNSTLNVLSGITWTAAP